MSTRLTVFLIFAAAIALPYLLAALFKRINLKTAASGAEKELLRQTVSAALPEESGYQVLYATWTDRLRYGRKVENTCFHYAIAFKPDRLWVISLSIQDGQITAGSPILYSEDDVGYVAIEPYKAKNKFSRFDTRFYNNEGLVFLHLHIQSVNTKNDLSIFNLFQQEECESFYETASALARRVNPVHSFIETPIKEKIVKNSKKARIVAIVGIIFFFIPFISLPAGLYSFLHSPKPQETGGKFTASRILSILCLLIPMTLLFMFVFYIIPDDASFSLFG
ncbi:MAG: hypothetical protein Q4G07_02675 [Oscillospiraceae bacterium]|nr:hypothetical protein [Oscillospiraceae bacterium]